MLTMMRFQLMDLPHGDDQIAKRDRAILRLYLYSGGRVATGCRMKVSDFKSDQEPATIRVNEMGDKRRTIGLHFAAADAVDEFIEAGQLIRDRIRGPSRS